MRDAGVIDALEALERYARAFDEVSAESDAHYSTWSFRPLGEAGSERHDRSCTDAQEAA